jgi:hypothetical protein
MTGVDTIVEQNEKLIINKPAIQKKILTMLEDLSSNPDAFKTFIENPTGSLQSFGIAKLQKSTIDRSNRLLFLILSNPSLQKWLKEYVDRSIKKYGEEPSAKVDQKAMNRDFLQALSECPDPKFNSTIDEYLSEVLVDNLQKISFAVINTDANIAISSHTAVIAHSDTVAIVAVHAQANIIVGLPEPRQRREFIALAEKLNKALVDRAKELQT